MDRWNAFRGSSVATSVRNDVVVPDDSSHFDTRIWCVVAAAVVVVVVVEV